MEQKLKVLAVVNAGVVSSSLAEVFCRDSVVLHHAPSGAAALILTGNSLYDLLMIEAPVPDLPIDSLMSSMQSLEWASAGTPALVMTDAADVQATVSELESYPVRVVTREAGRETIQQAVSELLGVPVRSTSRMMINVEVRSEDQTSLRCFQSENISESGLLLRGAKAIPVGAQVELQFTLPDETDPIRSKALAVRHTGSREAPGVGLRFVALESSAVLRLRRFVERTLAPAPLSPGSDLTGEDRSHAGV